MRKINQKEFEMYLQELSKREAIKDFYKFCVFMDPVFFTESKPHLKQIAGEFQKVYEGTIKKLAISMPPRAGKSYITSLFCAWMIGKKPDGSIMRNSYAADLAEKFSYDIRSIVQKPRWKFYSRREPKKIPFILRIGTT